MNKSRNRYKHQWVDDGKDKGLKLYWYTCAKCGRKKTKVDAFSNAFFEPDMTRIGNRSPECIPLVIQELSKIKDKL